MGSTLHGPLPESTESKDSHGSGGRQQLPNGDACARYALVFLLTTVRHNLTFFAVIRSFKSKALQRFFETGKPRGLSVQDDKRVARILRALEAASRPGDMDLPGYRFHSLTGDQKGRYSVRVTGNWRITFGWDGENVTDIDVEDYH
ncbi:type II toxin-antitoxin system RelE/ParE family toxin [Reyranella sp.]|uniref:type II toxin-antitoxin system RelE/ParE family toxin n=1 Tax=Reyranella sp. TaxID=1929291 RepID=UPI003D1296F4